MVRDLNVITSKERLYGDSPAFRILPLPSLNRYRLVIGSGTRCTRLLDSVSGQSGADRKLVNRTPDDPKQ